MSLPKHGSTQNITFPTVGDKTSSAYSYSRAAALVWPRAQASQFILSLPKDLFPQFPNIHAMLPLP